MKKVFSSFITHKQTSVVACISLSKVSGELVGLRLHDTVAITVMMAGGSYQVTSFNAL